MHLWQHIDFIARCQEIRLTACAATFCTSAEYSFITHNNTIERIREEDFTGNPDDTPGYKKYSIRLSLRDVLLDILEPLAVLFIFSLAAGHIHDGSDCNVTLRDILTVLLSLLKKNY